MHRILIIAASAAVLLTAAPQPATASCGLTDFDCIDREHRLDRLEQGQRDAEWDLQKRQSDAEFQRALDARSGYGCR